MKTLLVHPSRASQSSVGQNTGTHSVPFPPKLGAARKLVSPGIRQCAIIPPCYCPLLGVSLETTALSFNFFPT